MTRARRLTTFLSILVATACGTGSSATPGSATATPGATTTPSAPSPSATVEASPVAPLDGEWIVYQWLEAGGDGIFVMRPDGTDAHSLGLTPAGRTSHPDWSHDGTRIAYEAVTSVDGEDVWIADANGANAELAVAAADCPAGCLDINFPAWSPDDGSIALVRIVLISGNVGSTLDVVDLATGEVRVLYTSPALSIINYPRWSPDGASIVFEMTTYPDANLNSGTLTGSAIWVIDLDGGAPRRLTDPSLFATFPDWNPVEDLIAFTTYDLGEFQATDEASNLYLIHPDGSGLRAADEHPSRRSAPDPAIVDPRRRAPHLHHGRRPNVGRLRQPSERRLHRCRSGRTCSRCRASSPRTLACGRSTDAARTGPPLRPTSAPSGRSHRRAPSRASGRVTGDRAAGARPG